MPIDIAVLRAGWHGAEGFLRYLRPRLHARLVRVGHHRRPARLAVGRCLLLGQRQGPRGALTPHLANSRNQYAGTQKLFSERLQCNREPASRLQRLPLGTETTGRDGRNKTPRIELRGCPTRVTAFLTVSWGTGVVAIGALAIVMNHYCVD